MNEEDFSEAEDRKLARKLIEELYSSNSQLKALDEGHGAFCELGRSFLPVMKEDTLEAFTAFMELLARDMSCFTVRKLKDYRNSLLN